MVTSNSLSFLFYSNVFPDNIVGIAIYSMVTGYDLDGWDNTTQAYKFKRVTNQHSGSNMIGIIFVSVVFGLSASAAKEKGLPFLEFFTSLAEVVLKLIRAFLL